MKKPKFRRSYPVKTVMAAQRRVLKLCLRSLRYENQDRLIAIGSGGALWTYGEIRHHIRECLKLRAERGGRRRG